MGKVEQFVFDGGIFVQFFERKPIRRLAFIVGYVSFAILGVLSYPIGWSIIIAIIMLFGAYIAVVKSGLRFVSKVCAIRNLRFDIISIAITAYSVSKLLFMVL